MQRRELAALRMENSQLRGELSSGHGSGAAPPPAGSFSSREGHPQAQRQELPPLRSLSGDIVTVPESMTGIQYSEQPRVGTYRGSEARY